jgi:hypothetical protein
MKSRIVAIIAALLVFIIAFLFLVPIVSYSMPAGWYTVPPSYVKYGSITYWALGVGGTWRYIGHGAEGYTQGYSVSVVSATASASSTSSTSYTVTLCTFTTASNGSRVESCGPLSITATSTGVSTVCIITGQPGGAFLRVISDSTSAPVVGAVVTVVHNPAGCILNGVEYTNTATTQTFTTNGSEWTPLDVTNGGTYSFTVQYSGQTYSFTATLRPVSVTCATLYVPSGRTNSTITEFKSTCSSASPA